MTESELLTATREELVSYLEGWGYQCYDWESTQTLRDCAVLNHRTENQ